jgi:kanamycin kinase
LPNFLLDDWSFSGFIDLGNGGVGDRHIDIFWGIWTLEFNLKTNAYRDIFIDAYGRNLVNEDALRVISAAEVFG